MDDELKIVWKKAVSAYSRVLSQHSPGRSDKDHEVRHSGLPMSRAGHLPNTSQKSTVFWDVTPCIQKEAFPSHLCKFHISPCSGPHTTLLLSVFSGSFIGLF
jgi:hypothetical protein